MIAHHRTAKRSKVQRTMRPVIAATLPARCVSCPNHVNRQRTLHTRCVNPKEKK